MVATSPSAIRPSLPRRTTQKEVAALLAPYMELREGIFHRSPVVDWETVDNDIRARWNRGGLKRVKRMARELAAVRCGVAGS